METKVSEPVNATESTTVVEYSETSSTPSKVIASHTMGRGVGKGTVPYSGYAKVPGTFYGGFNNPDNLAPANRMNYDGKLYAAQMFAKAFFYTSDRNQKENINMLDWEPDHEKVMQLQPVRFTWKDGGSPDAGLIAQEVEEVIPEAVTSDESGYSIKVSTLIGYLVNSVQQLQRQVDELKGKK